MLTLLRKQIIQSLWETHRAATPDAQRVLLALKQKGLQEFILDHFAIIDLPSPGSGIHLLKDLFGLLGYEEKGKSYLPEKQNDFLWMAEVNCNELTLDKVLPQIVVADFRLKEMPKEISNIIQKYAQQIPLFSLQEIEKFIQRIESGDLHAFNSCKQLILSYLSGRDWPLPTKHEYVKVKEFNELLAWVLIFGRRPNHFTFSIHSMNYFKDLTAFHTFVEKEVKLELNREGGVLKGGPHTGLAQGSTTGTLQTIALADGDVRIPTGFIEFVWRYPLAHIDQPKYWGDYFTGFIASNADKVIESLYEV